MKDNITQKQSAKNQMETVKSREPDDQALKSKPDSDSSRRQFMKLLGSGASAGVGVLGTARAHENELPVVAMGNNYFDPIGLYVDPGTTVRFELKAGTHSATAYEERIPSDAVPFDSGTISKGGFEHTFEVPGTYDYYCIPHQSMGMVGRIVVKEPGGPAEDGPIPDGDVPDSEVILDQGAVGIDEFDSSGDTNSGMMDSGPGMMNQSRPGWMMVVPIGFLTTVIGVVGGVAYWAAQRGNSSSKREDSR